MNPKEEHAMDAQEKEKQDSLENLADKQQNQNPPDESVPLEQGETPQVSESLAEASLTVQEDLPKAGSQQDIQTRLQESKNAAEAAREAAREKRQFSLEEAMNASKEKKTQESVFTRPAQNPIEAEKQEEAQKPHARLNQEIHVLKLKPNPEANREKENKEKKSDVKQEKVVYKKNASQNSAFKKPKKKRPLSEIFLFHFLGSWFYTVGFVAECRARWFGRFLREALSVFGQLTVWSFKNVSRVLGRLARDVGHHISEPFVYFKQVFVNVRKLVREEQKKAGGNPFKAAFSHFKLGLESHGHLLENLASIFLPAVGVFLLVFKVYSIINTSYGLEVSIQGETVGYIENETVLEEAKAILRGRLSLAGDQNMEDWQFDSTLELARADSFTTKDQLVNAMLRSGTVEVVEATGLYMNNELIAVTEDGEDLKNYLDEILAEYVQQAPEDAEVSFVNEVQCDPEAGEVFLDTGLQSFDELLSELDSTVNEEVQHTVQEGETLGEIASQYNILFSYLLQRNPQFAEEEIDYEPEVGTKLLIQRAQPFLQVQTVVQEVYTEPLPFPVEEQGADDKPQGFRSVLQTGVDGVQEVQDELVYIDGELTERIRLNDLTTVVQEAVPEIVQVGTVDVTSRELREYSPVYTWPVPDYTYSSRGGGPGQSHRGRDINGPEGTPVYAANAGVVVTAGWHDSYGNYVVINHPDGLSTLYAHNSYLHVTVGQEVLQNELIANMGNTGFSFGSHLHLEFQTQSGELLNPDDYVVAPHGYSL